MYMVERIFLLPWSMSIKVPRYPSLKIDGVIVNSEIIYSYNS